MPTYTYKCLTCELVFDSFHKISDPNPPCKDCGSSKTTKQVTAPLGVKGGYMDTVVRTSTGVKR